MLSVKKTVHCRLAVIICCLYILPAFSYAQNCDALTIAGLKEKFDLMGYSPKIIVDKPGKEKYVIDIKTSTFDVPVGFEISPSTNFIWLTTNLGDADTLNHAKNLKLLQHNTKTQPSFYYISSNGKLMMAVAVENRGVTPAILRRHIDKLAGDVSSSSYIWK